MGAPLAEAAKQNPAQMPQHMVSRQETRRGTRIRSKRVLIASSCVAYGQNWEQSRRRLRLAVQRSARVPHACLPAGRYLLLKPSNHGITAGEREAWRSDFRGPWRNKPATGPRDELGRPSLKPVPFAGDPSCGPSLQALRETSAMIPTSVGTMLSRWTREKAFKRGRCYAAVPELFQAFVAMARHPLYGPPGTGKTMLAKAVTMNAARLSSTKPTIVGKYRGDSEKLVRVLEHAGTMPFYHVLGRNRRHHGTARGIWRGFRARRSRRMKTGYSSRWMALRHQPSGGVEGRINDVEKQLVFVLAASNTWELDAALLRRLGTC